MLTPEHVLAHHGGVARGTFLRTYGIHRRELDEAVGAGRIARIRQGVFAAVGTHPDIVAAAGHGGALTCARALRLHGVWTLTTDERPHVWLGTHGRVHHVDCDCRGHYAKGATVLGLAPLEDALVQARACHGDETFFAALESALNQRKIGHAARARIRRRLPADARWLVDLARSDAESGLESVLRIRLYRLGIRLDCQQSILTVGRVDFVIGRRLILEVDGVENHDDRRHRHKDLVRDAAASALGYETLRFDYALVIHDWPTVESAILGALARVHERLV